MSNWIGLKSGVVLLVLSIVVTYVVAFVDAFARNSFLAGKVGFPFRFSSSSFLGGESIDYTLLTLDIIFWFIMLFGIWKLFSKVLKKS